MACLPAGPAALDSPGAFRRWTGSLTLAVADQALASGVHFGISLLLARRLEPADYGSFALAYAMFLLAAGVHNAVILEPMSVIGPARYAASLSSYFGVMVRLHAGLTLAIAAALVSGAAVLAALASPLWPAVLAGGLAAPCVLLFWLARRACYAASRPALAAAGSLFYAVLLAGGLAWLMTGGRLSLGSVFLLMAGAAVTASAGLGRRLGMRSGHLLGRAAAGRLSEAAGRHWNYARWSLGSTALYWLAGSIYLPMVAALAGLEAVAAYRAADNLLLPMSQALTGAGLLILPWLSRQHSLRGNRFLRIAAVRISLVAAAAAGAYLLVILMFGQGIMRLVYGGDFYLAYFGLVPYLGAAVLLRAIGDTGFGAASRAAGRPDIGFRATALSAGVTLTAGLAMVWRWGAEGASAGWMVSSAAAGLAQAWLFRSRIR